MAGTLPAQITRTGTHVAPAATLASARRDFSAARLIRLPAFIAPDLLTSLADALERARWEPRIHVIGNAWATGTDPDPSAEPWAADLHLRDDAVTSSLVFLLNDMVLFAAVEAMTGCDPIRSFVPNVYKIVPGGGHYDDWHTDMDGARMVALSVNVGRVPFEGGTLQVRRRDTQDLVHQLHNGVFGDALLMAIAPDLEHRLTPVTGTAPRVAVAGWFTSAPSPFPGLPR